ncbi:MAG: Gfo/Idh/MocA family oxidoreductase [Pirellulaceae bacterium]
MNAAPRSPIGAAVVGTGFIGPVHVEGLRRAGVHVVGILGSSAEKSRAAAERLQLKKAYVDYDELLADADVQSVHLTTPNRFHFAQASAALAAGKHVMCEKPLAMNADESRKLVRLAAETSVAAGVNYNIRYYPLCLEAAARAADGRLGAVFHVAGSYVQDWLFHATDFNWRVQAEEGGELRAVADIGTHWLDLIWSISRLEVEAVCADLQTVYPRRRRPRGGSETFSGQANAPGAKANDADSVPITTDDYGAILLRFRGGARGVLWVSQVTAGRKNCLRFEIAGARESLAWNSEQPNELWIGRRDEPNQSLLRDPALLSEPARAYADYPGGHNEGFPDTFKQCFRAFYDYIEAGDFAAPPTFPTFADGHREIMLCEAILASHRRQGWVQLEETTT